MMKSCILRLSSVPNIRSHSVETNRGHKINTRGSPRGNAFGVEDKLRIVFAGYEPKDVSSILCEHIFCALVLVAKTSLYRSRYLRRLCGGRCNIIINQHPCGDRTLVQCVL